MGISSHLLEKFFNGDCTEEEKAEVLEFFRLHPEKLAQNLTESSWNDFHHDARQQVPTEKMRDYIERQTGGIQTPIRRIRYAWVAAASVIFLVALVFLLHKSTGDRVKPDIATRTPPPVKKERPMHMVENGSSKVKVFLLPDGSKVELASASHISYNDPYINSRRDIFLEGEATFSVKKDDKKPFVVHARGITTTALGTVFQVSDKLGLFTTVHLISGRVVVKKEDMSDGYAFKNIYLTPGQQLTINKENFSVQIKNPIPVKTHVDTAAGSSPQILTFTSRPLAEIFPLLQKEYKVTIAFDATALQNMTFTGTLDRNKESLESFLSTLCDLNDLSLKKTNDNHFAIQVK